MDLRKLRNIAQLTTLALAGTVLPGTAAAAISIANVSNAASRIPAGFPSYGIAQGAVFSVIGTGVGQDPPTQAAFPLPTTGGLAGVSMKVAVGSATVDAIMVFVSANEVDAILPSNTPLGTGTLTINNGGTTATSSITVVKSAFGIFTSIPGGYGSALAFTTGADGTTSLVSPAQPAVAGQTVTLAGTGLGAITGDETQSGATDVSTANISLWVGSTQVPVVSAGRGACCTGIDPTYPIPAGISSWDLISFVVPDGASGCTVPIAVQIGNTVSNIPSIAIAGSNGLCFDLSGITFDPTTVSGPIKTGLIAFTRVTVKDYQPTGTGTIVSDVGAASFQSVDVGSNLLTVNDLSAYLGKATGICTVTVFRFDRNNPPPTVLPGAPATPPTILDAGDPITVKGPVGSKPMPKGKDGSYSASFASVINIPLPAGLPPISQGGPAFLDPGSYVLDNGAGGADIGAFNVTQKIPAPITWDNIDQTATIDRTKGFTVKWTGGDPTTAVGVAGTATLISGTVSLSGAFICTEKASAGQLTVPAFVTLAMPVVGSNPATGSFGNVTVSNILYQYLPIPGVDLNIFTSTVGIGRSVAFQ